MKIMTVTDGVVTQLFKTTEEEMTVINKLIKLWYIEDALNTANINIEFADILDIEDF